jgi:hypothetical protein
VVFGGLVTPTKGIQAGGGQPTLGTLSAVGLTGSVGSQVGTDMAGSFVLTAGTASTAGGTQIAVTFATPLPTAPAAVLVTIGDQGASSTTNPSWGAIGLSTTGFYFYGGTTTASHTYLVSYMVVRQN